MKNKALILIVTITIISLILMFGINEAVSNSRRENKENRYDQSKIFDEKSNITLEQYGVSTVDPIASEIGIEIMRRGGNAVDAAVAISYALGVVEPYGSGIGGGGVMMIHPNNGDQPVVYDYLETSPLYSNMPSRKIGVPGMVLGLEMANKEFGIMEMNDLIEPSIILAEKGFSISKIFETRLKNNMSKIDVKYLSQFYVNNHLIREGDILKQNDLGITLRLIQKYGSSAFYSGEIADSIIKNINGIKKEDLKGYSVRKLKPIKGKFYNYEVLSSPPPFGGVTLIQMLNMAEALNINQYIDEPVEFIRIFDKIQEFSQIDRMNNVCDQDFVSTDYAMLTDKSYILSLVEQLKISKKIENLKSAHSLPDDIEDESDTTHFTVVDKNGMMVTVTNSLSSFFGSGVYIGGFFMNNHLSNFSSNPNSINYYRNGKRPRSFMSPTIFVENNRPVLGIGSPGGSKIPSVISQVILRLFPIKSSITNPFLAEAVKYPRFFISDNILYTEYTLSLNDKKKLREYGYNIIFYNLNPTFGAINMLYIDYNSKRVFGASDLRRGGSTKIESFKSIEDDK